MRCEKQINYLFFLNRDKYNRATEKIERVLRDMYQRGIKEGRKQKSKAVKDFLNSSV